MTYTTPFQCIAVYFQQQVVRIPVLTRKGIGHVVTVDNCTLISIDDMTFYLHHN